MGKNGEGRKEEKGQGEGFVKKKKYKRKGISMRTMNMKRRGICLVMVMILLAGALSMMGAPKAAAAEKKRMDSLKLNWDLKEGKTYIASCNDKLTILGDGKAGFTLKNLKKEVLKNGKKKVSFTINFKQVNQKLSSEQIHRLSQGLDSGGYDIGYYFTVIDKATGLSLEGDNELGVKVKSSSKYYGKYAPQYDGDGCGWGFSEYNVYKVAITYPADYKDLCVGVGNFLHAEKWADKDDAFWAGKVSFDKTTYYKWFKDDVHFINFK